VTTLRQLVLLLQHQYYVVKARDGGSHGSLVAVRLPGANVYDDPAVEFVVGGEMTCGFWEGESGRESWRGPHGKQGTRPSTQRAIYSLIRYTG
jgi:hypothetical protein